jgi:hypothetical protein
MKIKKTMVTVSEKKDCVVSFRISEKKALDLQARLGSKPTGKIYSRNQYARQIVTAFLEENLGWFTEKLSLTRKKG